MKKLKVKKADFYKPDMDVTQISHELDAISNHTINTVNWSNYPYLPEVSFVIAHKEGNIFLKFTVKEQSVLAEKKEINHAVCEDSCVEFFVSPNEDKYYNIEMNCIGTILTGYGSCRHTNEFLNSELISRIKCRSTLGSSTFAEQKKETEWSLVAVIPASLFGLEDGRELSGQKWRANFYKCGENLSVPHYVTWNPVSAPEPDFHRPECFGEIEFE